MNRCAEPTRAAQFFCVSDFQKLVVYQKWRRFARRMVEYYPRVRKKSRRLADQLERAVESIGDAIAEGRGRATDKDFANFMTTAISSATEAEHHLLRAHDYGVLKDIEHRSLHEGLIEIRKMLIGLRRTLRGE
jgi:four helix bundle protein